MKQEIIYNVAGGLSVGVLYALTYFGVNRQIKKMKSKVDEELAQYHNSRIAMGGMSPEQRYIHEDMRMLVSQKHCHSEGVDIKTVVPLPKAGTEWHHVEHRSPYLTGVGPTAIHAVAKVMHDPIKVQTDRMKELLQENKNLTKERDEALGRAKLNHSQYEKHKKDSQKAIELLVTERDKAELLANQYHDLIEKLQEKGKESTGFIKELKEKVAVLEENIKDEKENTARLKHFIKEKDEQIDNLTLRVMTNTLQGTGSSTKEIGLSIQLNASETHLKHLKKVNKDLKEHIEELKESKEKDLKEIDRLDQRLSNATKERKKLEKKISNQKVQLRLFNEERSQQVVELESIVSSLNNKLVTATFDKNFSKVSNDITLRENKDLKRTLGEVVNLAKSLLLALGSAPLLSRTDANTLKEVEKQLTEVEKKIK